MITFFGVLGLIITIAVAVPATLIALATLIENPLRTIIGLWLDLVETYKNLWYDLTK
jgi:hypothetical protein